MKRTITSALLAMSVAASAFIAAPAADAVGGADDCTRKEFRKIQRGMTLTRVQSILDGPGKLDVKYRVGGHQYQSRSWGRFSTSYCSVDFKDKRLTGKYYIG